MGFRNILRRQLRDSLKLRAEIPCMHYAGAISCTRNNSRYHRDSGFKAPCFSSFPRKKLRCLHFRSSFLFEGSFHRTKRQYSTIDSLESLPFPFLQKSNYLRRQIDPFLLHPVPPSLPNAVNMFSHILNRLLLLDTDSAPPIARHLFHNIAIQLPQNFLA